MLLLLAQVLAPVTPVVVVETPAGTMLAWVYGLLALAAIGALGALGRLLFTRAKADKAHALGLTLWENATAVVAHVEVHIRPTVKDALKDGQLTAEERAKLKAEALRLLKEALGEHGMTGLRSVLGLAGPAVEVYLSGLLERALGAQRAAGTLPPPGPAIVAGMNTAQSFLTPR